MRSTQPRWQAKRGWWQRRSPRILTAAGFAGAIAGLLLVLGIAGVRPFGTGGTSPAQADRQCRTVMKFTAVRRPVFTMDAQGRPHLSYRVESVSRPVIRCR